MANLGIVTPPKPIRCLVVQLGRTGDLVQSLMALRAAKQLYPALRIEILARESFAAAAKRVPWIDAVHTLDTEKLITPVLQGKRSQKEMLGELSRALKPVIQPEGSASWDMLVNWTYSEASSFLSELLPARVKLGYTRTKDGAIVATDGWSHYIQAIVQGRCEQNIHITDILTTQILTALQIHAGSPSDENADSPVTSRSFFALESSEREIARLVPGLRDPSRKWLGIQLGASNPLRAWPAESWAQVVSYILNRHPECSIVLLGGKEDDLRARELMRWIKDTVNDPGQVVNLVGRTNFDAWTTIISRCQWLFAGDTSATQIASVLGTRVMHVSVGGARHQDAGPYGNGHYVVSSARSCPACDGSKGAEHLCRTHVSSHAVYAAWAYASSEWAHRRQISLESHYAQLGWSSELANVLVARARIRGTEDGGGVVYEPMIQRSLRLDEWSSQVMGHIARAWYCGWTPGIGAELIRGTISPSLIQILRGLDEASDVMSKVCDEARRTAVSLHNKSSALKSQKIMSVSEREELSSIGNRLTELDALVQRLAAAQPALNPFAQMSKVMMHNLRGNHISELSKETAISYEQLGQGISIMRDWVKQTLNLARPVAIAGVRTGANAPAPSPEKGLNA